MTQEATPAKASEIPLKKVPSVRHLLVNDEARQQLATVAAKHMNPERMMRLMANAVRTTPKLGECNPLSLLGALMTCASIGLEPNTVLGHAYLIPFKNDVQLVIGYKGLVDLARRSGHITSISSGVHYDDDEFWEYEEGTEAKLRRVPGPEEGKKLHAYAIAQFKDGGHAYVVLPWARVMKIRDNSDGWKSAVRYNKTQRSPWFTHEDEMAKKTAVRALAKMLPLSTEMASAISLDERPADYRKHALEGAHGDMGPSIIDDAIYAATDDYVMEGAEPSNPETTPKTEPKGDEVAEKPESNRKAEPPEKDDTGGTSEDGTLDSIVQEIEQAIEECKGDAKALTQVVENMYAKDIAALPADAKNLVMKIAVDAGYGASE